MIIIKKNHNMDVILISNIKKVPNLKNGGYMGREQAASHKTLYLTNKVTISFFFISILPIGIWHIIKEKRRY